MTFCSNCGKEISEEAGFCSSCGFKQAPEDQNDSPKRKTVYNGSIKKCPNCGEPIKSFQTACPACKHEFSDTKTSNAIQEFAEKLEKIESEREPNKSSLLQMIYQPESKTDRRIANLIQTFVVPNTREDIFEFMVLASSSINTSVFNIFNLEAKKESSRIISRAWLTKMEQVYRKAKLNFGKTADFLEIKKIYDKVKKSVQRSKMIPLFIIMAYVIFCLVFYGFLINSIPHYTSTEEKMNAIIEEIQLDISNGDYDSALIKANKIRSDSNYDAERWDNERETLIEIIKQAKKENQDGNL